MTVAAIITMIADDISKYEVRERRKDERSGEGVGEEERR